MTPTPTMAALAVLLAGLLPAAAGAQLRTPSLGEALRDMDRLRLQHDALPQTFVVPERPGQNLISWYDFRWHHYDVPSPSGGRGGIRLYYYEREQAIAERALPVIRAAYVRLVDQFHYTPTRQIPYILYSSKREFQTTNVFQVGESVLGVTSTRDLKMSLPYFGDHERFREVSTHEMVHQFTIQKLLDIAGADDLAFADNLPLWFIEGIAEYYSKGGIDHETDGYLRDLVWNPDPERGYQVLPFFEDRVRGYIPTYKMGQARVAFIAETYGKEKVQALLEGAFGGADGSGRRDGFGALARRVLNDAPEQVDSRWRAWLKRRYYPAYTSSRQDLPQTREITGLPGEVEHFAASPDGWVVLARALDRERGEVRLLLFDLRHPKGAIEVASDNESGIESLHPIDQNILAMTGDRLLFSAQDRAGDSLYLVPYRHEPPRGTKAPRLTLGRRTRLEVRHPDGLRFIEIADPTFSPEGDRIAFVGLTDLGQRDIYVVPVAGGTARRVTDDPYAERDLAWGKDGIYFSADATEHGRLNLFRIDEAGGARSRLTTGPDNDRGPRPLEGGGLLFSSDAGGRPDLFRLEGGKVRRLSDFTTGLHGPAPAPEGRGILAATFFRGRFRLVELPRVAWVEDPALAVAPEAGPPLEVPREPLVEAGPRYDPLAWRNWHPDAALIYGGGGANGVVGRAAGLFSDLLRDRQLYVDVSVWGSWDLVQALALYEDRQARAGWVAGAFQFVNQQFVTDPTMLPGQTFLERDFGAVGVVRYPFDRYQRLELELSAGGVDRFCLNDPTLLFDAGLQLLYTANSCSGPFPGDASFVPPLPPRPGYDPAAVAVWREKNIGVTPKLGPTVRYGYDNVRLDPYTGPIDGDSLLLELASRWLPARGAFNAAARLEAARWFRIYGRSNFMLRAAAGTTLAPDQAGRNWARAWWLTSEDNLRGFTPFDTSYLIGLHYWVANAEVQFPLNDLLRLFIFDYVEGVAALDFGAVADTVEDRRYPTRPDGAAVLLADGVTPGLERRGLWASRTLTGVLGVNVLLGPLLLRWHFGHPFDVGGLKTPALLSRGNGWVQNVSLRWAFF